MLDSCPALVLNADFRPLSYFPLSLWSWQDAVKAVFLDRVTIVDHYDTYVRSPSLEMRLPSVIALKEYVQAVRNPAFTRFNVFLRDRFSCQYCGEPFPSHDLTFDHVVPRSRGGKTVWANVVTACSYCNLLKGNRLPRQSGMYPLHQPLQPSSFMLQENGRAFPPNYLHDSWRDYLYWDTELDPELMSFSLDEALIRRIIREASPAAQQTDAETASLGFGLIHYSIVRALRVTSALVIGSKQGFVPVCQAIAMRDDGRGGRVVFVDPGYSDAEDGFKRGMGGVGFWKSADNIRILFDALGVADIIVHRKVTSQAFFAEHGQNRDARKFHLVYIDGDHGYDGFRHDFIGAFSVLDDDGLVMFHDSLVTERSIPSIGQDFGGFDFLEAEGKRLFDDIEVTTLPIMPGLGFARRGNPSARGVLKRNFAIRD